MSAIRFDNVSKRFVLHHEKARSFQDLMVSRLRRRNGNSTREEFWALREVSFEVPKGQMVGIIGPNGAGKSTMLKLIARIFEPTKGKIAVDGRLNALIELGAGFHQELTGRENIYLSAALLGLSRRDIQKQFDEIVAFSELEKFIDTQVKHYSSGMNVRLGFAVATCIESDVLLVDEVLAVGDANFQRKCFERIDEIRARGTTIFWVTHSMPEVERSCDRALLLMDGRLEADGHPATVIAKYEELRRQRQPIELGFYNAEYLDYEVPAEMSVDGRYQMSVTVHNHSPEVWHGQSSAGAGVVMLSYHWLDRWGNMHQLLGLGTPLPNDLQPGEAVAMQSTLIPPTVPGQYRLEIDLMGDGRGWFSRHGCLGPQIPVNVILPDTPLGTESDPPLSHAPEQVANSGFQNIV
jgi:ABC-type polysaccharide/polyol phosphate transport system ATPase subunit